MSRLTTLSEAVDAYIEVLDDDGPVQVAGSDFWPAQILRACDPIMFRCGFWDWVDGEGIDGDQLEGEDYRLI